jgi:hypothetical protein
VYTLEYKNSPVSVKRKKGVPMYARENRHSTGEIDPGYRGGRKPGFKNAGRCAGARPASGCREYYLEARTAVSEYFDPSLQLAHQVVYQAHAERCGLPYFEARR